jgi:hypothetical protein
VQHHEIADVRVVFNDEHAAARLAVGVRRVSSRCHCSSLAPRRLARGVPPFFHRGATVASIS